MLFLHGFPELWSSWRHQLEAFREDYDAVAIDMRGYGQTEPKPKASSAVIAFSMQSACKLVSESPHAARHSISLLAAPC